MERRRIDAMTESRDREHRLGFPLDDQLTEEMLSAIEQIRLEPGRKAVVTALIDTILKLTDTGLREYYVRPLEQAGAGMIALGTAKVGIRTAKQGISMIVPKVLRGMSEAQLRSIADSMEGLLIRVPDD
jgi:hypothetical protein